MKIEVLGTGCARCNTTEEIVKQAVLDSGFHRNDDLINSEGTQMNTNERTDHA